MQDFEGKIAVVTGGASGMGRQLVLQLVEAGCHVATCDLSADELNETRGMAQEAAPNVRVTTHLCDISSEEAILKFRDEVVEQHETDRIHLLFNNAGLSGGGSLFTDSRESWDRCFAVCWGGVYYGTRAFLPLLVAADEGHIINTSSVNGFWASMGPERPHTAYSAAKFAVKGFTEALISDFRVNAPHLRASVVMPGHIGTSIVFNSGSYFGRDPKELDEEQVSQLRQRISGRGVDVSGASDEDLRNLMLGMAEGFRDNAPTSAAEAATIILEGVRNGRWRILVGDDAHRLDEAVRKDPERAYTAEFLDELRATGVFAAMPQSG
jgi:NAD(P)-dependent dehydrogenase (short-subunit alcohol dehydrogenase family)